MRRLAAVFSSRRSDKSDTASSASTTDLANRADLTKPTSLKSRSGFFKSLNKPSNVQPDAKQRKMHPMSPLSTLPDHAASSSSSFSGGPTTPNDDQDSLGVPHVGKKPWLPLPFIHDKILPPTPAADPSRPYIPRLFADDKDDAASSLSSHSDGIAPAPLPPSAKLVSPSQPLTPLAYCRAIAANALKPPFSPGPLLVVPNAPLYPRSCNTPGQLARRRDDLRYRLQQTRLLRQLEAGRGGHSLASFASRRVAPPKPISLVMDDNAVAHSHHVAPSSIGLRRWTERPCFEDRVLVYLPADHPNDGIRCERVFATAAVEALGYTESLELLAGLADDDAAIKDITLTASPTSLTPPLSLTPSTASLPSLPPSPSAAIMSDAAHGAKQYSNYPHRPSPSPLRLASSENADSNLSSPEKHHSSLFLTPQTRSSFPPPSDSPSRSMSAPNIEVSKPAVRFADDDRSSNDSIPLEYVMRIKQARDQKAKFLAAERARRQSIQGREATARPPLETPQQMRADLQRVAEERRRLDEERRRQEVERRKQEEERKKLDKERAAWDRERKALEEERKQKYYAEELAEARRRREGTRQGASRNISEGSVAWNGDRERERERRGSEARSSYSRPKYDDLPSPPRRQASEPSVPSAPSNSGSRLHLPSGSSPGSSRPPSIATGSVRDSSRPPSMYSTPPSSASAVDVRTRRESKTSRRTSFMSDGSPLASQQMFMQPGLPSAYPWGSVPAMPMNMVPVAVPVPVMQMPMMPYDMPLLPPTAPFMMQAYGHRGQGQRSHSSSPTRSDKGQGTSGRASPHSTHRRIPSDESAKYSSGLSVRSSPYAATPVPSKHSPSSASMRSTQTRNVGASQSSLSRPQPVTSWSQPSVQHTNRPPSDRRQTMIR